MKSKLARFKLHDKFQDGDKVLEVEGFYRAESGNLFYYIKGEKNPVSEEKLSQLEKINS